jgi:hypothetical protein
LTPSTAASADEAVASVSGEMALLERFRKLSEAVAVVDDLGVDALRTLLEQFPPGWARRRALESIFRSGKPRDLAAALAGVDLLGGGSQRLWALTTLAGLRDLDERDVDLVLSAADSPLARRRLELRLG